MLYLLAITVAFVAGCFFQEWRSMRKTARYIDQFHKAPRLNTRKGA